MGRCTSHRVRDDRCAEKERLLVVRDALEQIAKGSVPSRYFAPFLTNHDQKRLATELGGDIGLLKAAAALLLGMPGTPFLYYGEEMGTCAEQKTR